MHFHNSNHIHHQEIKDHLLAYQIQVISFGVHSIYDEGIKCLREHLLKILDYVIAKQLRQQNQLPAV
jgi:hypothetical protein